MPVDPALNALPTDRDGFRFRGGSAALDLAATRQARLTPAPRELLAAPSDLDRWLVSAGLAPRAPGASETDLATTRVLREIVFTLAGGAASQSFDGAARDTLNHLAATPSAVPILSADGRVTLSGSVAELLSSLARDAVRLFGSDAAPRIKQCGASACTIFFLDTSRSGDRRWCSMSACGNTAKVAEFRRRKRAI